MSGTCLRQLIDCVSAHICIQQQLSRELVSTEHRVPAVGLVSSEDITRRQPLGAWDDRWAKDLSAWWLWQEWQSRWERTTFTLLPKSSFFLFVKVGLVNIYM